MVSTCTGAHVVHYEYMALAKKTSVVCVKLCYHLLNHRKLVPRRVCGRILKPCLRECCSGYIFAWTVYYIYIYIYIHIYICIYYLLYTT